MHTWGLVVGGSKELPDVKVELGFESQPVAKCLVLTMFRKTSRPTKIEELGTFKGNNLLKIRCASFFVFGNQASTIKNHVGTPGP